MSTIETSDAVWAACRLPGTIIGGRDGDITPPSSPTPPDFLPNYPAAGIVALTKVATGRYLVEFEQASSDNELLCFVTLHGAAGSVGGATRDAVIGEFAIPNAAKPSIYGATRAPEYFRQLSFTDAAAVILADPANSADLWFLHLPFTGQYST
ncbi:MAG: hypothetical protein ACHREM_15070 [Polyangiales bacterium]